MTLRTTLFLVATLALAGCSTAAEEAAGSASSDVIASGSLAGQTIIKGKVSIGETSKVGYQPETNYPGVEIDGEPYLAWEIVAPSKTSLKTRAGNVLDAASITVGVVGDFPGDPNLLVVDKDFKVLGQTTSTPTAFGDEASVVVYGTDAKFVLVRDNIWVAPMEFEITVTQ